jgi:uncharacterized glyoxalase superfamily protein PhnB
VVAAWDRPRVRGRRFDLGLQTATWGARPFAVRDPDGVSVTFLEWTGTEGDRR